MTGIVTSVDAARGVAIVTCNVPRKLPKVKDSVRVSFGETSSLEDRIKVLEAQVRSLQLAMPRGFKR